LSSAEEVCCLLLLHNLHPGYTTPRWSNMLEALILLCELGFALLLLIVEARASKVEGKSDLGFFRYTESISLTPDSEGPN